MKLRPVRVAGSNCVAEVPKINKLRYRTRVARTARPGPRKRRLAVRVHRCPMREVT